MNTKEAHNTLIKYLLMGCVFCVRIGQIEKPKICLSFYPLIASQISLRTPEPSTSSFGTKRGSSNVPMVLPSDGSLLDT